MVGMQMSQWYRKKGWGCVASSVGEAQQSVHSQKREANEREEELCWGRDALPKKYDIGVETGAVCILMRSH